MFERDGAREMLLSKPDVVTVRIVDGVPAEMHWRDEDYRVTDRPTPLHSIVAHEVLTHPLRPITGWRFQGTNAAGESFVFDARKVAANEWELFAVYR